MDFSIDSYEEAILVSWNYKSYIIQKETKSVVMATFLITFYFYRLANDRK